MAKMSKAARSKAARKAAKTRKANKLKRRKAALAGARRRRRPAIVARVSRRGRRRVARVSVRLNPKRGAKKGNAKKGGAKRGSASLSARVSRVEKRVGSLSKEVAFQGRKLRTFGMPVKHPGLLMGRRPKIKTGIRLLGAPGHMISAAEESRLAAKYNPIRRRKHRRGRR